MTTVVFQVRNTSSRTLLLEPSLELPEGWSLGAPLNAVALDPGDEEIVFLSVIVPVGAEAGLYRVGLEFAPTEQPEIVVAGARATVEVAEILGLEVDHTSAPESVLAGEEYTSRFMVSNTSNRELEIDLSISSRRGIPFVPQPGAETTGDSELEAVTSHEERFTLEAGESREVALRVRTPEDLGDTVRHRLAVSAEAREFADLDASAASRVEIIAVTPAQRSWHRFPMEIRWKAHTSSPWDGESSPVDNTVSLSGEGSLEDSDRHHASFNIEPPGFPQEGYSSDYAWEEGSYFGEYWNDLFGVAWGDSGFSVSAVPGGKSSGRGLEGYVTPELGCGDLLAGGFYVEGDRGAYAEYEVDEMRAIEFGVYQEAPPSAEDAAGAEGEEDRPAPQLGLSGFLRSYDTVTVRYGAASSFVGPEDYSLVLDVKGELVESLYEGFRYEFSLDRAGADYYGAGADSESYSASTRFDVNSEFRLRAGFHRRSTNLSLDPEDGSARRYDTLSLGSEWGELPGLVSLGWRGRNYYDLFQSGDAYRQSHRLSADWRWSLDRFRLDTGVELDADRDFEEHEFTGRQTYSLAARHRPVPGLELSARGIVGSQATVGGFSFTGMRSSLQLEGSYTGIERTRIGLTYRNSAYYSDPYRGRDTLRARLTYRFDDENFQNASRFSADVNFTIPRDPAKNASFSASLSYRQPLEVPVSPRSDIGIVEGRIIDRRTGDGIPEAIVAVSEQTAVTDEDGWFSFPAAETGRQKVRVDLSRIDERLISLGVLPREVEVRPQERSEIEIEMTAPVRISGRVLRYDVDRDATDPFDDEPTVYEEVGGVPGAFVEITGPDGQSSGAFTDGDGRFLFRARRPGNWTVSVYEESLPENFEIERTSYEIEVAPGTSRQVEFEIEELQREMQMLDPGEERIE